MTDKKAADLSKLKDAIHVQTGPASSKTYDETVSVTSLGYLSDGSALQTYLSFRQGKGRRRDFLIHLPFWVVRSMMNDMLELLIDRDSAHYHQIESLKAESDKRLNNWVKANSRFEDERYRLDEANARIQQLEAELNAALTAQAVSA